MSKEIEYPRRCLECEHYELEPYDENITYKCGLSKAKRDKCIKEIEDYFKEL